MKILIVDDEEVARTSLTGLLAPMGEVLAVGSGEQALALLEGGLRPDICCSDILMPGIDGLELMRRARAHPVWKDLPFVLISVAAERDMVEAAVAAGAVGYILKPFLAVQTRCTVERVVRDHRARRSEHFLITSRRLGLTLPALEDLLARFAADVDTVATDLSAGRGGLADLRRLHASTVAFGMWKASALLREAIEADTGPAARVLALVEVRHLVEDQVDALTALAPLENA
jgi:two-component system chemotaxis response regulator CheY